MMTQHLHKKDDTSLLSLHRSDEGHQKISSTAILHSESLLEVNESIGEMVKSEVEAERSIQVFLLSTSVGRRTIIFAYVKQ